MSRSGPFSVIAKLAIGEGASYEAQQAIKALGSTNIIVRTEKPPETEQTNTGSIWTAKFYGLKYRDADRIAATLQNVAGGGRRLVGATTDWR
mgnify:CR=1 FL=1